MIQPKELRSNQPLKWSTGTGVDVWELFCACVAGELPAIERLLDKDPSLVRSHYSYRTPLYFAVRENQVAAASLLLNRGAAPQANIGSDSYLEIARDRDYSEMESLLSDAQLKTNGASGRGEPIAAAIRARDLPLVRERLEEAPDLVRAGDERSNQPIHWATMTRQLGMIDLLLERGADIDAPRSDGARPIQLCNGDYFFRGWRDVGADVAPTPREVLDHLRDRGAYVDITTAASIGDLARVSALLDEDVSLANRVPKYVSYYVGSGAPLKNAASQGHLEVVRLLLSKGADPNLREEGIAPQGHALYAAAANGHHEVARLLLEHGAYPNPEVESSTDALSRAISNRDDAMVELLCSYGAAQSLDLLAYAGDVRTAAAMLAANPALADDPEALSNAAGQGHGALVRLLLRYEPELPQRLDFPSWSVGAQTRELNELLFQHGLNPSQPDWLMVTPLHHFARTGDVEKASLFLEHGADVHARDEECCSTPLGWAAKFGSQSMVELLLERGAAPNHAEDPAWATPLAWATRRQHGEIVEILKEHGANE